MSVCAYFDFFKKIFINLFDRDSQQERERENLKQTPRPVHDPGVMGLSPTSGSAMSLLLPVPLPLFVFPLSLAVSISVE